MPAESDGKVPLLGSANCKAEQSNATLYNTPTRFKNVCITRLVRQSAWMCLLSEALKFPLLCSANCKAEHSNAPLCMPAQDRYLSAYRQAQLREVIVKTTLPNTMGPY